MRQPISFAIFALLGITASLWAAESQTVPIPDGKGGGLDRWEYGELTLGRKIIKQGEEAIVRTVVLWITSEQELEADDWAKLAGKLSAPAPKKGDTTTKAMHKLRVLNQLGSEGWELVSYHPPRHIALQGGGGGGGGTTTLPTWLFKRRVVK
jgi:hypothetical protein